MFSNIKLIADQLLSFNHKNRLRRWWGDQDLQSYILTLSETFTTAWWSSMITDSFKYSKFLIKSDRLDSSQSFYSSSCNAIKSCLDCSANVRGVSGERSGSVRGVFGERNCLKIASIIFLFLCSPVLKPLYQSDVVRESSERGSTLPRLRVFFQSYLELTLN